ncbi:MAG TPA: hypothetical protein VKI61_18645 [Chitinophagaceae bacterium]|nr:hypothetical protein [Chitinophagaceae bacterium]
MIVKKTHKILYFNFSGINANNKTVSVVKTVIECPDGKLANPTAVFPTITKLLLSNTTAGLGTVNIFFNKLENIRETSDADTQDSHIFGAYTIKILKNDKKIEASPNWVTLYRIFGNWPKL